MSSNTASGRPTTVTVSFIIWFVVVVVNIISGIIGLLSGNSAAAQDNVGVAVGGAVVAFIIAILELIVVFKMRDGRNWARIVLLVLAIFQLIGVGVGAASGGNAFGWIGAVAVIVATILMFVGTRGYFTRR
ncbi:hypothetical protein [Curtobacterium sp. RRHDQ10]|uniref:hypothetical protein n=1 Tax=Curtobacterium phyllosphaerae TaxID=3413379 RepID=UPI003BEF7159